jgi:uncharacterized protein (TIGR03437 family)
MRSEPSSIAPGACGLRAMSVFVIVSTLLGLGFARAYAASGHAAAKLMSAPLSFEPNQGQTSSEVQFLARGSGYALSLTHGNVVLHLDRQQQPSAAALHDQPADTLRMSLIGASATANAVGQARQDGVVSYFIGNDPKQWRTGIPTYGKVGYPQVYPGVDLVFYGNQRQLEYDFIVTAGADPGRIAWQIQGARVSVDPQGRLVLTAPHGRATFEKPVLYQLEGDRRTTVDGSFAVDGSQVRFRIGRYDRSKPLVIDPVLRYATWLAGTGADYIGRPTGPGILQVGSSQGIAVDASGSAYVTGYTFSKDFPTTKSSYQSAVPAKDGGAQRSSVFVTKFSPDGSSLVYSTYLGGNSNDYAYGIAVDASGNAYVTGQTNSVNFPVTNGAYQTVCSPTPNNKSSSVSAASASCNSANASAFVTKLNQTGTALVYSTFLGGYGLSYGVAVAVDAAGRAYVAGQESQYCSTSYLFQGCFPTTSGAIVAGSGTGGRSPQYAFAAVFDPTGAQLLYSTLFGDLNGLASSATTTSGTTLGTAITVDSNGNFYLAGETQAGKLPTTLGVVQPSPKPLDTTGSYVTAYRGFIAKFAPVTAASVTLAYSTYLGGSTGNTSDYISGIAIDSSSNAYVVGYTNSADFPVTSGAYGTVCGPGGQTCSAAHVTKLDSTAQHILWSTYVGSSKTDNSDAVFFTGPVQLDAKGNVYITGIANPGFPLINSVQSAATGIGGQVVAELDPTGTKLLFSTGIGSGGRDSMMTAGLAVDASGNIYVAGDSLGPNLITTPGAFQTTNPAPTCCYHGFVAKIEPNTSPQITVVGTTPDVYNAATFKTGGIAPNEFISLIGTGLGPVTGEVAGMATQIAGTSVSIGGTAAYLTYAQDGQINLLVPFNVSGLASTTIQVEYNGVKGNTVTVPVIASSPGIFTQSYGPGQVWMVNQDNTFNSSSNPAPRNTYVAFWVTGQGLVNTTLADGTQPSGPPFPTPMLPVSVSLGGVQVPAANLAFDGLIYSGEVQINVLIPANAPTGSAVPLVVTIGGVPSRSDATMAIQ